MTGGKLKIDIRRTHILEQLQQDGKITVMQLSELLDVTPATIRNDLDFLEQEGYLLRVQGGAVPVRGSTAVPATQAFSDPRGPEKRAIALEAAQMVKDGETLFINSGTTTEFVAEALSARSNLNVVTNSLAVARTLGVVPTIRVLLLGGEINASYGFTHGGDAQEQLLRYQADWAILSVDGVSAEGGITTYHAEEAVIDRMMLRGAKNAMIVADHSKIGRTGFSRVREQLEQIQLVTGGGAEEALEALQEAGVQITRVSC